MAKTTWALDPTHSEIQFKVRHMMITNVTGSFTAFSGTAEVDGDDFSTAKIAFTAKVDSITTHMAQRDADLKGPIFFDAEKYPDITFTSTGMSKADADGNAKLTGDLTIKGVTKKVTLDVVAGGTGQDMRGNTRAGFSVSGKINRMDYGLAWNAVPVTGGVVLGEEVKIACEVQLLKPKE